MAERSEVDERAVVDFGREGDVRRVVWDSLEHEVFTGAKEQPYNILVIADGDVRYYGDDSREHPGKTTFVRRLLGMAFDSSVEPTLLYPEGFSRKPKDGKRYIEYSRINGDKVETDWRLPPNDMDVFVRLRNAHIGTTSALQDRRSLVALCSALIPRLGSDSPASILSSDVARIVGDVMNDRAPVCSEVNALCVAANPTYRLRQRTEMADDSKDLCLRVRDTSEFLYQNTYGSVSVRRNEYSRHTNQYSHFQVVFAPIFVFDATSMTSFERARETCGCVTRRWGDAPICSIAFLGTHAESIGAGVTEVVDAAEKYCSEIDVPLRILSLSEAPDDAVAEVLSELLASMLRKRQVIKDLPIVRCTADERQAATLSQLHVHHKKKKECIVC